MLDARASGSPAPLRDARLPAVEALLGPAAPELMEAAVRPHGGSIGSLRPSFVEYWPGSRIHVRYDATVIYPSGPVGDTLVAVGGGQGTPPGPAVPVELGDGTMV